MSRFALDGQSVLVTGAHRGLGRAIADGLAGQGARVYGTSRDPLAAGAMASRYGTSSVVLDVLDVASAQVTIAGLIVADPTLTLLVNNAGINIPQPALEVDVDAWESVIATNLRGPFFVAQAFCRGLVARGSGGAIVNVGSQAGTVGIENRAAYGASKAGLALVTKVMAIELGAVGIRVNNVAPTFVRTELTASTLGDPVLAERLLSRIPAGRFGTADDVVGGVAYLLSDAASLVTGHTLAIDGGYTAL